MKLLYIETNSFIADETKTLDFTDYLGRPHKVKGVWGRNGSGKTFIAKSIEALFYPVEDNHLSEAIVYIDLDGEQIEINFPSSNLYQYRDKVLIYTPPPYVKNIEKPTEPTELKYLFRPYSKHKYLSHGEFYALSIARFVENERNKLVIIDDADLHMDKDQLERLVFYLQNKEDNNQYIIFFKLEDPSFLYESEIIYLRS